jgi:folate-binding protein YgfZ
MLNFYKLPQDYLKFEGTERLDLINRLSTNEVKSLPKFSNVKTILTSDKGRFVDLLALYNLGEVVFASCSLNNARNVLSHLEKYTIMDDFKPKDITGTHETLLFYGDEAGDFAANVLETDISQLADNEFKVSGEGNDAILCKNDDSFGGVIFTFASKDKMFWEEKIFSDVNKSEYGLNEVSEAEFETKRIELGIPKYGKEMTELTNPLECGLNKYVSFTKGCYIGQEVIARLDAYDKISKHMVGVTSSEPIHGSDIKITVDGKECGFLTSSTSSDKFGNIGIGFVKTIFLDYGKSYKLKSADTLTNCRLTRLPFKSSNSEQ